MVDSPSGDLVITAAHCVSGATDTLDFVPGYNQGSAPYGVWTVTKVYVDQAWSSSSSQDDDFAFLRVSRPGSSVPIEDVTGAERLDTNTPASRELVQVIGYPNATNRPVTCLATWPASRVRPRIIRRHGGRTKKNLSDLTEQELLALAIALEEEDIRTYSDLADAIPPREKGRGLG